MNPEIEKALKIYLNMVERERNIYELAELFDQKRRPVSQYVEMLRTPNVSRKKVHLENGVLKSSDSESTFQVRDEVVDFRGLSDADSEWGRMNAQFLNYHKSLSPYTLMNSAPVINYVSIKSGVGNWKDIKVLDVGGGTGHTLCSFFRYPEQIEYFLLDPNLRLIHDQFIRVYPQLSYLPMAHVLGYAEHLPFEDESFDLVMSLSSIDHFKDYEQFIKDAYRILKPGGHLLVSSHLDIPREQEKKVTLADKLFREDLVERIARYVYFRKHRVGEDDHTYHFEDTKPFETAMTSNNFEVVQSEIYSRYFFTLGKK